MAHNSSNLMGRYQPPPMGQSLTPPPKTVPRNYESVPAAQVPQGYSNSFRPPEGPPIMGSQQAPPMQPPPPPQAPPQAPPPMRGNPFAAKAQQLGFSDFQGQQSQAKALRG